MFYSRYLCFIKKEILKIVQVPLRDWRLNRRGFLAPAQSIILKLCATGCISVSTGIHTKHSGDLKITGLKPMLVQWRSWGGEYICSKGRPTWIDESQTPRAKLIPHPPTPPHPFAFQVCPEQRQNRRNILPKTVTRIPLAY